MNRPSTIFGGIALAVLMPLIIFWALVAMLLGRERLVKELEDTLWGFDD